jgi:hypothetical protein
MILFLKGRIVLVRTFTSGGDDLARLVTDGGNGDSDSILAEQIESEVEIFCTMVQNTIHAFKWHNNQNIHPEKVFFTGPGALYTRSMLLNGTIIKTFILKKFFSRDRAPFTRRWGTS